jgi:hypothetical protein
VAFVYQKLLCLREEKSLVVLKIRSIQVNMGHTMKAGRPSPAFTLLKPGNLKVGETGSQKRSVEGDAIYDL